MIVPKKEMAHYRQANIDDNHKEARRKARPQEDRGNMPATDKTDRTMTSVTAQEALDFHSQGR
ncbi:MAG TPA: hypothetical protein VGO04_00780, partial [Ensifer sp.]|nr:hypothetical protein [Ensifer sp.]